MDDEIRALREAQFQRGCDRYAQKLVTGRGGQRRDGDVRAQVANFMTGTLLVQRVRSDTARVLDSFGVATIVRPYYYSFALALNRRNRELWSAGQLLREGRSLVSMWMARGLVHEVLLAVARQVLGLDLSDTEAESGTGSYHQDTKAQRG